MRQEDISLEQIQRELSAEPVRTTEVRRSPKSVGLRSPPMLPGEPIGLRPATHTKNTFLASATIEIDIMRTGSLVLSARYPCSGYKKPEQNRAQQQEPWQS